MTTEQDFSAVSRAAMGPPTRRCAGKRAGARAEPVERAARATVPVTEYGGVTPGSGQIIVLRLRRKIGSLPLITGANCIDRLRRPGRCTPDEHDATGCS